MIRGGHYSILLQEKRVQSRHLVDRVEDELIRRAKSWAAKNSAMVLGALAHHGFAEEWPDVPPGAPKTNPIKVDGPEESASSDGDMFWRQSRAGIKTSAWCDQEDGYLVWPDCRDAAASVRYVGVGCALTKIWPLLSSRHSANLPAANATVFDAATVLV